MTVDLLAVLARQPSVPTHSAAMMWPHRGAPSAEPGATPERDRDGGVAAGPPPARPPHWPRVFPGL